MARISRKKKELPGETGIEADLRDKYPTGIYIRLSGEEIENGENHKLENQEQVVREYINTHPEFYVVKVYCDNGLTGTNFERHAFQGMMEDIKAGLIKCIMVKDLSRLGRNHIETEEYIRTIFPFLGVRFIAVNDNFDNQNKECDMIVSLKNIINDAYARDISRKVYSSKQAQRLKGEFVGNIPPYGYEKSEENPHKLVISPETGYIIPKIFALKVQGLTNTEIAQKLNCDGDPAPMAYWYQRGKVHLEKYKNSIWESTTVKVLLKNQMYIGDMVQGKKQKNLSEGQTRVKIQPKEQYIVVPNTHEPLIERALFYKVQEICDAELQRNRMKRNRNSHLNHEENIFLDKVFSKEGLKMYRNRNVYEGNKSVYHFSSGKRKKEDGTYFPSYYISEDKVSKGVDSALHIYIDLLFSIQEMQENPRIIAQYDIEQKKMEKEVSDIQKKMEKNRESLAVLYKHMVEGMITLAEYQEKRTLYQEEKLRLQKEEKELRKRQNIHIDLLEFGYEKALQKFIEQGRITKKLLDILVSRINVLEEGKIEIHFLFEDEVWELYHKLKGTSDAI